MISVIHTELNSRRAIIPYRFGGFWISLCGRVLTHVIRDHAGANDVQIDINKTTPQVFVILIAVA